MTKQTVAIYARVSTTDQTLDAQLRDLRSFCESRGWEPTVFTDHGISGAKDSRPGWNQCWDSLQKGRCKVLVVHALDRIGRSLPHLVSIINSCGVISRKHRPIDRRRQDVGGDIQCHG